MREKPLCHTFSWWLSSAFSQHCGNKLKHSPSDIIQYAAAICFVPRSVWFGETETMAEKLSLWKQRGMCMCLCGLGLCSPAHHINQTKGLSVIIVTHSGFNKSLLWDYWAIWCWVDCAVIMIIIIIYHTGLCDLYCILFLLSTVLFAQAFNITPQWMICKFPTLIERCYREASGQSNADHHRFKYSPPYLDITAAFCLTSKRTDIVN